MLLSQEVAESNVGEAHLVQRGLRHHAPHGVAQLVVPLFEVFPHFGVRHSRDTAGTKLRIRKGRCEFDGREIAFGQNEQRVSQYFVCSYFVCSRAEGVEMPNAP
jgi:hypothetical protein